jgi:trigger factor
VKIDVRDITETRKELVATISAEELQQEREAVAREFSQAARIPGFRPGKAPLAMIAKRYEKEIAEELKQKAASRAYREAIEQSKVEPIQVVDVEEPSLDSAEVHYIFTVDIRPQFELPEYVGLPAQAADVSVKDEEIDQVIEGLRRERAEFKTVDRASQKGDYLKMSLEGSIDGQPITEIAPDKPIYGKMPQTWEEVGTEDGLIPGLAQQLEGLKAGEKREATVQFPADFQVEALAGKAAVYQVEALEVRERALPPIDEDFLKSQQVSTHEELREQVGKNLGFRKEMENRNELRRQVTEALGAKVDFPLPESLVETETQSLLREFIETNMRRGIPQEEFEKNKEELHSGARKAAMTRVKSQMLLSKVAEAEKIRMNDADVNRYIMREAMRSRQKPEKLAKELSKDRQRIRAMEQAIVFDKALDFLVDKATVSSASQ